MKPQLKKRLNEFREVEHEYFDENGVVWIPNLNPPLPDFVEDLMENMLEVINLMELENEELQYRIKKLEYEANRL
jgi:hypothetical protein